VHVLRSAAGDASPNTWKGVDEAIVVSTDLWPRLIDQPDKRNNNPDLTEATLGLLGWGIKHGLLDRMPDRAAAMKSQWLACLSRTLEVRVWSLACRSKHSR
jgi:hypothetical protein